jgi:molybdopterin synthase catalytic subunit
MVTLVCVTPPDTSDTWVELSADVLPVGAAYDWAVRPQCGAVVLFSGTVRDHADGRDHVTHINYEAYAEQATVRMNQIIDEARRRWPDLGRVALLHRTGVLALGESSVLVVVSAPHRPEAFEAGRFCIDTLKVSVPIWKHEEWSDGSDWGTRSEPIVAVPSTGTLSSLGSRSSASNKQDEHQQDEHQQDEDQQGEAP